MVDPPFFTIYVGSLLIPPFVFFIAFLGIAFTLVAFWVGIEHPPIVVFCDSRYAPLTPCVSLLTISYQGLDGCQ